MLNKNNLMKKITGLIFSNPRSLSVDSKGLKILGGFYNEKE